jgi:hypothetical protein
MNQVAVGQSTPRPFKYLPKVVGTTLVLLGAVVLYIILPLDLPSFGAGVSVKNFEGGAVSVHVQSALTDETILILPGESGHYKLFAGDHGNDFSQLTQNPVLLTAAYEDQTQVEFEFPGQDLYEKKRAAYALRDGEFVREARHGEDSP